MLYLSIFRKSVEKFQVLLKSNKNNEYFIWRPITFLIISCSVLLIMRNVSDKIVEKIKKLCSILFSPKILPFIMWKNIVDRAGHRWQNSMAHAHSILDTQGCKYTFTICKTFWYSLATMVWRTHLNIALYGHCLSWCFILQQYQSIRPYVVEWLNCR